MYFLKIIKISYITYQENIKFYQNIHCKIIRDKMNES